MMPQASWRNRLLLFIPGTLWGSAFWLTEIVLQSFPPFTLTATRNLISATAMIAILYWKGGKLPHGWRQWRPMILIGLLNNALPFSLMTWGQVYIDSGLVSILISTMPLFSILMAHYFTEDDLLTRAKFGGVLLGSSGILVLIGPGVLQDLGTQGWAQLGVIAAALCYAVGGILVKNLLQRAPEVYGRSLSSWEIAGGQFICSTLLLIPLSLFLEQPWRLHPSLNSVAALLTLALPISIFAMQIYYHLIEVSGPSVASLTVYLIPIIGVLLGALILHEPISWQMLLALLLIFLGIAIVNGTFRSKKNQLYSLE